jgi:hypothetical protein
MKSFAKIAAGLSVAVALGAGHAQAATWVLDYASTGAAPTTAHLTIDTSDTLNAVGGYDVTGFGVGSNVDGDVVTGLITNLSQPFTSLSADGMFLFDNVFYAGGAPVLSNPGLFFSGASGVEYNLFSDNASTYELYKAKSGVGYLANSVGALTTSGGAVPEPAAWTMMIVGFGGIGAVMRRRRSQPALA